MGQEKSGPPIYVGAAIQLIGGLVIIGGFVDLITQAVLWLKDGTWQEKTLVQGLQYYLQTPPPKVSWRGIQMILDWFLSWPLSIALMLIGFALMALGAHEEEKRRHHQHAASD